MTLTEMAKISAAQWQIPEHIVCGICEAESGWNPLAIRSERLYRYNWDVVRGAPFRPLTPEEVYAEAAPADFYSLPGCSRQTEWWQQDMSWGLMQVMGAVARESGCAEPFLSALCAPEVGLFYGCCVFRRAYDKYKNVRVALAAYNGGAWAATKNPFPNEAYVQKVLSLSEAYR